MPTVNELALILMRENGEATDQTDRIAVVEQWISDAVSELASLSEWKFFQKEYTLTTVIGTSTYEIPAEALDLKYIRDPINDERIEYCDPEHLVQVGFDIDQQARPRYWWYQNANLATEDLPLVVKFSPVPDIIYNFEAPYYFHPGELETTDLIPVPRDKFLVVKNMVRAKFFLYEKELEMYQLQMREVEKGMIAALNSDRKKHARELVMQIRDIPSTGNRRFARLDPSHY